MYSDEDLLQLSALQHFIDAYSVTGVLRERFYLVDNPKIRDYGAPPVRNERIQACREDGRVVLRRREYVQDGA